VTPTKPLGVILAGGQGARMRGQDKGLLEINGRKLVEFTVEAIRPQVSDIIISANRNLSDYQKFTPHVIKDISGYYSGPLAGVYSVMDYVESSSEQFDGTTDLLIVPCDMPLLPSDLTTRLYETRLKAHKTNAVAVSDGIRIQPLCCLLPLALKPQLKAYLENDNRKVMSWLQSIEILIADFSDEKAKFANINSHEDLSVVATQLKQYE